MSISFSEEKSKHSLVLAFFVHAFPTMSILTMSAFTIERVVVTYNPFQKDMKKFIIFSIVLIFLVSFTTNVPASLTYTHDWNEYEFDDLLETMMWSLYIAQGFALLVILPSNVLLVFKLNKENMIRRYF